jgi:hypothetical protein
MESHTFCRTVGKPRRPTPTGRPPNWPSVASHPDSRLRLRNKRVPFRDGIQDPLPRDPRMRCSVNEYRLTGAGARVGGSDA